MQISILEKRKETLFDLAFLSSYLRLGPEQALNLKSYLEHLVEVATDWTQERLGKTILSQTIKVVHRNNDILLPYGPVQKENIQSVTRRGRVLKEGSEYSVAFYKDTQKIKTSFSWKSHAIEIVYRAGYGDHADDVPLPIKNSILRSIETLYHNGGDIKILEKNDDVLASSYRHYSIY